ncbi:MAG: 50S ribosomal protein L18 [bacterium]|nr:50S ribosomal protein L18 [bacterium]
MKNNKKVQRKDSRKRRIRAKVSGTAVMPRLSVFTSNKHVFAQIIDDTSGKTIVSASDYEKGSKEDKGTKSEISKKVGLKLAGRAKEKKVGKVVFDRGGKLYHGRVKAIADGAREGGLEF